MVDFSTITVNGQLIEVQVVAERYAGKVYQHGLWRVVGVDTKWHRINEVFFDKGAKKRIVEEVKRQATLMLNGQEVS